MPKTLADEQRLIENARHDAEAFRQLYSHYFPRVFAYVAYRVGRASDAEDIVADVFLKVVESLGRFEYRGEGSFAAWLFRIAFNEISQVYREHSSTEHISLDDVPDIQASEPAPDEAVIRKEQFIDLRRQINLLSPHGQEILTLKFFGGLRNNEIASVLGLDECTVASHLCRAIDDLREQVESELDKEDHL